MPTPAAASLSPWPVWHLGSTPPFAPCFPPALCKDCPGAAPTSPPAWTPSQCQATSYSGLCLHSPKEGCKQVQKNSYIITQIWNNIHWLYLLQVEWFNRVIILLFVSRLDTHSHNFNGPAILFAEDADGLLQCILTLLHIGHLLLAVPFLLLDPRTLKQSIKELKHVSKLQQWRF